MKANFVVFLLAAVGAASPVRAQEGEPPPSGDAESPPPDPGTKPKKPPYSLPWQLRPVIAGNALRSDTSIMMVKPSGADSGSTTIATSLLFSYKVTDELAPLVRLGYVTHSPAKPSAVEDSGSAFLNPVLGALYAPKLAGPIKLGAFLGVALPFGSNGGDDPEPKNTQALGAGFNARAQMDNAMFAVNYFTVFPGVGVAYVADGLTVQAELTVLQLMRVRAKDDTKPGYEPDSSKTNLTSGVHVGYFVIPMLSLGAELRYQRWLSSPERPPVDARDSTRDNLSVAAGPRFHFEVGEKMWLRPGIAYARFLDKPANSDAIDSHHIVQIDVPFAF